MTGPETFGARLRAARTEAHLSQAQLAELSGIPKPRLSRYENGHILPSLTSLVRLAQAIGVPKDELLPHSGSPLEVFVQEIRRSGITFESADDARRAAAEVVARFSSDIVKLEPAAEVG